MPYKRITGGSRFLYRSVVFLKGKSRISIHGIKLFTQGQITYSVSEPVPVNFTFFLGQIHPLLLDWKVFLLYHRWSQIARCARSIVHA